MRSAWNLYLIAVTAALLAACGGPSPQTVTIDSARTPPTLTGVAAKGVIWRGVVVAEELDLNGRALRTVGTATTGAAGEYDLQLNPAYGGGPLRLTLTAGPDTEMRCDAAHPRSHCGLHSDHRDLNANGMIDRGEWFAVTELQLIAMLPNAETGASVSASITPYTHLAAELAGAGPLNASGIQSANDRIAHLLGGLNIIHTSVPDLLDAGAVNEASSEALFYAAVIAATLELIEISSADGLVSLSALPERLRLLLDRNPQLYALLTAATRRQFQALGRTDLSGLLAIMEATASSLIDEPPPPATNAPNTPNDPPPLNEQDPAVPAPDIIDGPPSAPVEYDGLEKTKRLVTELRTWGTVLQSEVEGEVALFQEEIALTRRLLDRAQAELLAVLGAALHAANEARFRSANLENLAIPGASAIGNISVTEGDDTLKINASIALEGQTRPHQVSLLLDLYGDMDAYVQAGIKGLIQSDTASLTINSGLVLLGIQQEGSRRTLETAVFDIGASLTALTDVEGEPLPVSFEGTVQWALNYQLGHIVPVYFDLTGGFAYGERKISAGLAANIRPMGYFDPDAMGARLALTLQEQLEGRPRAWFTVDGELDAGALLTPEGITIGYEGYRIAITSANRGSSRHTVHVHANSGVAMDLKVKSGTGAVTYNGMTYATIKRTNGVIRVNYVDGTFESLL